MESKIPLDFLSSSVFAQWRPIPAQHVYWEVLVSLGPIYPDHIMMFICSSCKVFRVCKYKWHKHFKRSAILRWTQAFCKATINNELTVDNSFEFEKYRNEPVKYQQELWNKTTDAMKTVEKIKCQAKCIMNKLKKNKGLQKVQDIKEIRQNSSWPLLQAKKAAGRKDDTAVTTGCRHGRGFLKISWSITISTFTFVKISFGDLEPLNYWLFI